MTCKVDKGNYEGEVTIPAEVTYNNRSFSVTTIGYEAFLSCTSLISVNIPNSVTTIGYQCFKGCSSLVSVNIPNSVTYIGYGVFRDCSSLVSVNIPNSVTYIGSSAFRDCSSLISVNIPDSVTKILFNTFYGCSSLINIYIPESVTSIEGEVFNYCTSIESITIPNSVTSLGITNSNGSTYYEEVFGACTSLKSVILSDSLTEINPYMFWACRSLTYIHIPNSITYIGNNAFDRCSSLTSIDLPDKLESISYGLFKDCNMLQELIIPGSVKQLSQYLYREFGQISDEYTFDNCNHLEKLSLLPNDSFELKIGCTTLDGEKYFTSLYGAAWTSWTETIKELYIDRILSTSISVPNLEKLVIGEHMQKVQVANINKIKNLTTIESHAIVPPELPGLSNMQYMNINVYVPEESLEAYKADPVWGKFWNIEGVAETIPVHVDREKTETARYDLSGKPVNKDYKGFVIVRFSDGSVKKILQ